MGLTQLIVTVWWSLLIKSIIQLLLLNHLGIGIGINQQKWESNRTWLCEKEQNLDHYTKNKEGWIWNKWNWKKNTVRFHLEIMLNCLLDDKLLVTECNGVIIAYWMKMFSSVNYNKTETAILGWPKGKQQLSKRTKDCKIKEIRYEDLIRGGRIVLASSLSNCSERKYTRSKQLAKKNQEQILEQNTKL